MRLPQPAHFQDPSSCVGVAPTVAELAGHPRTPRQIARRVVRQRLARRPKWRMRTSLRQDVQEEAAEKLDGSQSHHAVFAAVRVILVAKGHALSIEGHDPMIGNGDPMSFAGGSETVRQATPTAGRLIPHGDYTLGRPSQLVKQWRMSTGYGRPKWTADLRKHALVGGRGRRDI
jgi:hypothetical protein